MTNRLRLTRLSIACAFAFVACGKHYGTSDAPAALGSLPDASVVGGTCSLPSNCQSGTCVAGVCAAMTAANMVQDGDETDVDCGGQSGVPCAQGKHCIVSADCASRGCLDGACGAPSSNDGIQDGDETGIDCGGTVAPSCCTSATDCASGGEAAAQDAAPPVLVALKDADFANAPSNGAQSADIKRYFPKPPPGHVRINMYGVVAGPALFFTNAARIGAPDQIGRQHWDDYGLSPSGMAVTTVTDTWVFVNDATGVKEIHDYFYNPSADYAIESNPFDHGNIVSKGGTNPNVSSTAYGWNSAAGGNVAWPYFIWLQDIKAAVTTPGGTFKDVTSQAEQQGPASSVFRLRWYFALDIGYIAMTSMDANWSPVNTIYILRTCLADAAAWLCP